MTGSYILHCAFWLVGKEKYGFKWNDFSEMLVRLRHRIRMFPIIGMNNFIQFYSVHTYKHGGNEEQNEKEDIRKVS